MRTFRWILLLGMTVIGAGAFRADQASDAAADEEILKRAGVAPTEPAVLQYLRNRALSDSDFQRIQTLIRQLGDDSFEIRERASAGLVAIGTPAEAALRDAAKGTDVEVVRRAEECLRLIRRGANAGVASAAARFLARRKPAAAAEVLLTFLPFAEDDGSAQDVRDALFEVAVRDGKPDPAVATATSDKSALRRAAAAEALCRANQLEPERLAQLIKDPDPTVRLRVGLGLIAAKNKDGVPLLIELIGRLPDDCRWMPDQVLSRMAGENAPMPPAAGDEQAIAKHRQAWSDWWGQHGESLDLAKLDYTQPLGYTLLLMLDAGRVMEIDAKNNIRWQFDGLQFPLDVQLLPNNRVLAAEHQGRVVTERDLAGKLQWQQSFESPLVAQRLPNGNTFMASHARLLEVTRAGDKVLTYSPPNGEQIMKAQKLRNGEIALILTDDRSRFVQIDANGKELRTFPVNVHTSGGRIEVLTNGNVLVPEHRHNRVVEYDTNGNEVWQVSIEQPVAAVRLPNGNTLVTSMSQMRAVEFDRRGQEVWQYKTDTRVTRAFRR